MNDVKEIKMQIQIAATVLLLSVGFAFGGQWLFDKCFCDKSEFESMKKISAVTDTLNNVDSVRKVCSDSLFYKQR